MGECSCVYVTWLVAIAAAASCVNTVLMLLVVWCLTEPLKPFGKRED